MPLLGARQVLSALGRLGFEEVHRKGSHVKLTHPDGRIIIIPFHNPVDRYTLKGALKDADIDIQDFLAGPLKYQKLNAWWAPSAVPTGGVGNQAGEWHPL